MKMAFKKYIKQHYSNNNQFPTITITKSGHININEICRTKYFNDSKDVELYFDEDILRIGIQPLTQETTNSLRINQKKNATGAFISGKGFLKFFGQLPAITKKYSPAWNETEHLLEIHVGKALSDEQIRYAVEKERKSQPSKSTQNNSSKKTNGIVLT